MYVYDEYDQRIVEQRAQQFRDQVRRRLSGELTEDEFKPLRLQNGLYLQLHAYMLRIAVPYGLLSSAQLRQLAHITRKYDRGYAHLTTRQNVQLNWPKLTDVPSILDDLASVQMHAIQTSGNCVRNVTSDPFAGVAADEVEDPRPYCEILRQYSTFHPEFAYLPRKFKIAVTGAKTDRAAIAVHDVGIRVIRNESGETGFEYYAGGGQGRTPVLAKKLRDFLPLQHLLSYTEAVLRVYNELGRRDNKFKARIKITINEMGTDEFRRLVDAEHERVLAGEHLLLDAQEVERMKAHFVPPAYESIADGKTALDAAKLSKDRGYARWVSTNLVAHRVPGYAIVQLSTKSSKLPPGDLTDGQLDAIADIADQFSFGQAVVTHRQNMVLTDVKIADLPALYAKLVELDLATPNLDRLSDIIACPGLDYCDLANARSIPVAMSLQKRFDDLDREHALGALTLNMSGCINACGHHHVGNIGILGIEKLGEEAYQVMLGGSAKDDASIGKILGRALTAEEIPDLIERVLGCYLQLRQNERETFLETYRRVGINPFKEAAYAPHS